MTLQKFALLALNSLDVGVATKVTLTHLDPWHLAQSAISILSNCLDAFSSVEKVTLMLMYGSFFCQNCSTAADRKMYVP